MRLDGAGRRSELRGDRVLRGVDLTLGRGEMWRVDGVNGAGKSTLLRLPAGIDAPSAGYAVCGKAPPRGRRATGWSGSEPGGTRARR